MATYKEIQSYVKATNGFVPKTCWIAHMKEVSGIPVRTAYNRLTLNKRKHPCPPSKQKAIYEAFRHFHMI